MSSEYKCYVKSLISFVLIFIKITHTYFLKF